MQIPDPILVTGAAGFIGRSLVNRLISEGYTVAAFDLPGASFPTEWQGKVDLRPGDVRDPNSVQRAMQGIRTVFHLAAITLDAGTIELHHAVTVEGTRHIMQAAADAKSKVVLTASVVCYGDKLQQPINLDEDLEWGAPAGYYSTSKQQQEQLARTMAAKDGTELVIVRPGNVYGPGSPQWVTAALVELLRGTPALIGGGSGDANLVYVENLVEALILAASNPKAVGRTYNAADGFGVTWKQYFTDLAQIGGARAPKPIPFGLAGMLATLLEFIWHGLKLQSRPPITYEAVNLIGAKARQVISRARDELGYNPIVSYQQALAEIAQDLKQKAE